MLLAGNMCNNKLVVAAAGSGKTTYLVKEALSVEDKNVLITTYTEANEAEIRKIIIKETKGYIPQHITIQTWFSFLLQHGVRPYQNEMNSGLHEQKIGFYLTEKRSGFRHKNKNNQPIYWGEGDFFKYYFTKDFKIYSDKISKFIVECDKKTNGEVISRISRIFPYIYIDEIQDLAGWELVIIDLFFNSKSNILLVGDPRQVAYLTHHSSKYNRYKDGKIKEYIENECKKDLCNIDMTSLQESHRNNKLICDFSSKLFPEYNSCTACTCEKCRSYSLHHEGIFLIKEDDVKKYCEDYSPTILKYKEAIYPEWNYGKSKGLNFDRVLIYPTNKIKEYLKEGDISKIETVRAKFYVALTRARYSVGIICDYDDTDYIEGLRKYNEKKELVEN